VHDAAAEKWHHAGVEAELRVWTRHDAAALKRAVAASPDLSTEFGGAHLNTVKACADFIDHYLGFRQETGHNLAIAVKGLVVGSVGLSNIDRRHDVAWAYYWVAAAHRGQGLATRALATMTDSAFRHLDLFRVELGHRVDNLASCAVAKAAGFSAEGIERSKLRFADLRFDVETHARLVTDPTPDLALLPLPDLS
jgi:ribosomal-protein-alanine N-acetyltransferase